MTHQIAAVSAGVVQGIPCLDLCYQEDSTAETDMNFVMNGNGEFIELQGTGEGRAFTRGELNALLLLGEKGIRELMSMQRNALGSRASLIAPRRKLVLASNNAHKLRELKEIIGDKYDILSMRDAGADIEIEETGSTFAENAIIKAEAVCRTTGLLTIADDSGLVVDALEGKPGVHSARFSGIHGDDASNNTLLMLRMTAVPDNERSARYVCCIALASPYAKTMTAEASCEGMITRSPRGQGGFGYDPYFQYENGLTFAEMSGDDKNRISHRGLALQKIRELL